MSALFPTRRRTLSNTSSRFLQIQSELIPWWTTSGARRAAMRSKSPRRMASSQSAKMISMFDRGISETATASSSLSVASSGPRVSGLCRSRGGLGRDPRECRGEARPFPLDDHTEERRWSQATPRPAWFPCGTSALGVPRYPTGTGSCASHPYPQVAPSRLTALAHSVPCFDLFGRLGPDRDARDMAVVGQPRSDLGVWTLTCGFIGRERATRRGCPSEP